MWSSQYDKASLTSGWIMLGQILTTDEEELNLTCRRLDPQTGEKQKATLNEIATWCSIGRNSSLQKGTKIQVVRSTHVKIPTDVKKKFVCWIMIKTRRDGLPCEQFEIAHNCLTTHKIVDTQTRCVCNFACWLRY